MTKKLTRSKSRATISRQSSGYDDVLAEISDLLEAARSASARAVNTIMTATYWQIGRRVVELEQGGAKRAGYGERLLGRLSDDLSRRFGRGFSERNLDLMRLFYLAWPISQTPSAESGPTRQPFPLPWSAYVRLLGVRSEDARKFYEAEAIRGGWSVRQIDRQISTQFYERTMLSRNKAKMLTTHAKARPGDRVSIDEEVRDPYVLEFLNLKDEYSEAELEEAIIRQLETFLLEMGGEFAFVGRQKRLRIGDDWFRLDLLLFHRRLRCLVVIDLKLGKFTHGDAGQMHMYLNYARANWMMPDENPPVGIILCDDRNAAVAKYALEGLPNKMLAAEYRTTLPEPETLAAEVERTRRLLEGRKRT